MQRVFALEVHGLRHPTSTTDQSPVLLSTGELYGLASAVAELASHTVLPRLALDPSGYNWTSDPRKPLTSGGDLTIRLNDQAGIWGTQLIRNSKTDFWDIEGSRLEPAATTLRFTAKVGAPPVNGQICWIEGEAIAIDSTPALVSATSCTYTCDIVRGVCGSRDVLHRLDPAFYVGNGKEDRMMLDSRPNFEAYTFTGSIWLFTLDQFGAVASYVRRYVYLDPRPRALPGRVWEFTVRDLAGLLEEWQPGSAERQVSLSHRLQRGVYWQAGYTAAGGGGPGQDIPDTAFAYLTRLEAEKLFREPVHQTGHETLVQSEVTALFTRILTAPSAVRYAVEIEASGKWLYRITGVSYLSLRRLGDSTGTPFARLALQRLAHERDADIYTPGEEFLAPGWSKEAAFPLGYDGSDPTPPKLTLRVILDCPPVEALLYLCCSDGASSSDPYDVLIGRVGPGLPSSWFNLGAASGTPATIDLGTTELLERAQLLDEPYSYHLPLGEERSLAEFLSADVCLLHGLLFGPLQTGLLTLRPWIRPQPVSISELRYRDVEEIEPGSTLARVRALELQAGLDWLTLEPRYTRVVRARDVKLRTAKDLGPVQKIRIWRQASASTLGVEALTAGNLANLVRAWLDLYGGEPVVYETTTTLDWLVDNAIEFGDFVTWSSEAPLSYLGTGISGTFLVFGYSIQWKTGKVSLRLVLDTFNEVFQDTVPPASSWTAPSLRPTRQPQPTGTANQYTVPVASIADAGIDLTQAYDSLLNEIKAAGGYLRITRAVQGVTPSDTEREGYLEGYLSVDNLTHNAGTGEGLLTFTLDSAWERDGFTIGDLLVAGESFISLSDRRPNGTSVAASDIEPASAQLYQSGAGTTPVVKVAGQQTFDKTRYLLGS